MARNKDFKSAMKQMLLLWAGFSRNWGGCLASEAFEYLLAAQRCTFGEIFGADQRGQRCGDSMSESDLWAVCAAAEDSPGIARRSDPNLAVL
jgi:hypothetical protein